MSEQMTDYNTKQHSVLSSILTILLIRNKQVPTISELNKDPREFYLAWSLIVAAYEEHLNTKL